MNLVPLEFTPLPLSPRPKLPPHCIYTKTEVRGVQLVIYLPLQPHMCTMLLFLYSHHNTKWQSQSECICRSDLVYKWIYNCLSLCSVSKNGSRRQVEPQKFIFPPSPSLTRPTKIDMFGLPLTSRHTSPHHILTTLTTSPAILSHTSKPSSQFLNLSTISSSTPLHSPLDTVTPTPISVPPTANRLVPVLPEAHALYVNLSLLDSALGTTLSEPLTVDSGDLMQKLNKFMSHSRRLKLDSVAADLMGTSGQLDSNGGSDLFNFQVHVHSVTGHLSLH